MSNYPRLNACLRDMRREIADFDEINAELNSLANDHTIEPIDDPMTACDFWDWADVVGIVDEFCPAEPFWAEVN
jgi:hypothetical protein